MQTIQKARLKSGQFAPGQSGNPGGRPKDEHRVAELARSYTLEAIDTLVELMRDCKDERMRGTAAQALLDRGWGKAKVEVVTGAEGSYLDALRVVNERLVRGKRDLHIIQAAPTRNLDGGVSADQALRSYKWSYIRLAVFHLRWQSH